MVTGLATGKGKSDETWKAAGAAHGHGGFAIHWRERGAQSKREAVPRREGGGVGLRLVQGLAQSELRGSFEHHVIDDNANGLPVRGVDCTIVVGANEMDAPPAPSTHSEPAGAT